MPYEPFIERFGEFAWKETRSITVFKDPRLAGDEFAFLELYCNDEDCDRRRVMFNVISKNRQKDVAVIAYGWESKAFYAKWLGRDDPKIIKELQGPVLNLGSHQSELAPALLEKVREVLLADPAYVARLKRHYQMFKEKVDPKHFRPQGPLETKAQIVSKSKKRRRR